MARDGKVVLTLWEQRHGQFKMHRPGLHHLAVEARSVEEVNRTKGILNTLGAQWGEGTQLYHEGPMSAGIYFSDPDGMRIEPVCSGEPAKILAKRVGSAPVGS
jgi:catechol-2,3-dioxygenase